MSLQTEIETLSQRIGSLTGAINAKNHPDVLFWMNMKSQIVGEVYIY